MKKKFVIKKEDIDYLKEIKEVERIDITEDGIEIIFIL